MVDSFCQAYHWRLEDVLGLTVPQIIMFNHAASVNSETARRRMKKDNTTDAAVAAEQESINQMDGPELSAYLRDIATF